MAATTFKELPKSIIVVSEQDNIRQEGILFHERMLQDGRSSVIFEIKGIGHLAGDWTKKSEAAQPAADFVVEQLKKWKVSEGQH